jgi:hypothetical protein|tara:strand:+ start:125 stop:328 length:204 start_codon:yes stop_codon:yes gene_type:complete
MSVENYEQQRLILEERKTKATEKIARCLDALTLWFEEIDKDGWNERAQFYLSEFQKLVPEENESKEA